MITIKNEDLDIEKIADSGQCFRMNKKDGAWVNIACDKKLCIYEGPVQDGIKTYKLDCSREDFNSFWKPYFDLQTDYSAFRKQIPASDKFLSSAADFGKGIRILRQDPWEMLITFIISQRKNIPAIKAGVEAICRNYGDLISESQEDCVFSFPTVHSLACATEDTLKNCGLGYRVPYIISAARMVDSGELDLEAVKALGDEELLQKLMSVYGVGIKVANCVSLFAYHRIDAFPIDVWIARVLEEQYHNEFPFDLYKGFGGVIQQYMFYYARSRK